MVLVWEYLFCDVDLHFVVVILHLSSFVDVFHFVVVSSFDFQATLPFDHHSTLASQTREASTSSELYPDYFWLPFLFHLPRALWFWVGIFYPQVFFTLRSFPTFWHNLLLSRFHWEPAATFLKVAGLHTDLRNTDPAHLFVWFTVIHNLLYILNLYLYMSILQKFLLVVKTLIKNIDQQPN